MPVRLPSRRAARALLLLLAVSAPAATFPAQASAASSCAAAGVAVTPLQSSVLYIDSDESYLGSYLGYNVQNTGATGRTSLWLRLEAFSGGAVSPGAGGPATAPLPLDTLAAGATRPGYAYLKATGPTLVDQGHDVVLYAGRPGAGGVELCRETQTITAVADVIKAAANKVSGATLSSASASLGSAFALTVTGDTGTIGAGPADDPGIVRFSPAVAAAWPADAFRLTKVEHRLPAAGVPHADVLFRSGLGSWPDTPYSVTYTFRVVGPTSSPTPLVPVQNIASGTQVKHTDPGSLGTLPPIPVVTSSASMAVDTPTPGPYTSGQTVPLTATITNAGSGAITVDAVEATLPAGWTYAPGSAERDGSPITDPHAVTSTELHLVGPFSVPANGTTTFQIDAVAGAPGTSGPLTAQGVLEGGQIDATTSAGDDQPASKTLVVLGPPTADDDIFTVPAGIAKDLDVTANDVSGGATPTVSLVSAPDHGTASVVDGQVRYTAAADHLGADAFAYELSTPSGTDTATVTLDVVAPPPAPAPTARTSSGVGTTTQQTTLAIPSGGTVRLVDGDGNRVTSDARTGVGTFTLTAATGVVTFAPVLGYTGSPAITYEATDEHGQTGTSTYTPTVTAPAAPAPAALTSTGIATVPQTRTAVIPTSGNVTLLDAGGDPAGTRTVAGEGAYVLDAASGVITFTPVLGFSGPATPVTYRVTDAYAQTGASSYTPTVTKPAGPSASARSSTGTGTATQTATLPIPASGSVSLLSALGVASTSVTVLGQGTYGLDALSGTATFTPIDGFAGTATPVAYRVTDPYGQTASSTYAATVNAPGGPSAAARTSSGVGTAAQSATLSKPAGASVRLLDADGGPAASVSTAAGVYVLDLATGSVTFTPALGFAGTSSITYRVTDPYGQTAEATYSPTVTPPVGPAAAARTSTGAGVAPQSEALPRPTGGIVRLLDPAGTPASEVVIAGQGRYVLDPATGQVTFTPVLGFKGVATPLRYRVTDPYGQSGEATYTPTVSAPAAPDAAPQRSVGKLTETQARIVPVPVGGKVELLDLEGVAVSRWRIPGVGEYAVDPDQGLITFTPEPGFTGTPQAVRYRVTDAYGQSTEAAYQAEVERLAAPGVTKPSCVSRRSMTLHWWVPKGTRLQRVDVAVDGARTLRLAGTTRKVTVDLKGVPRSTVTVRVRGRTAGDRVVQTVRTYRTCRAKQTHAPLETLRLR